MARSTERHSACTGDATSSGSLSASSGCGKQRLSLRGSRQHARKHAELDLSAACALDLPHRMTTQVEAKPLAVIVTDFIFDLIARDRLVAHGAHVARSSAGVDLRRPYRRQPTIFDALSGAQPQRGIPQFGHRRGSRKRLVRCRTQPVSIKVWAWLSLCSEYFYVRGPSRDRDDLRSLPPPPRTTARDIRRSPAEDP